MAMASGPDARFNAQKHAAIKIQAQVRGSKARLDTVCS